jgi:hypothetical protein
MGIQIVRSQLIVCSLRLICEVAPVFLVYSRSIDAAFKGRGQRQLDGVSPDEAARRIREIELKSLLVDFKPLDRQARRRK